MRPKDRILISNRDVMGFLNELVPILVPLGFFACIFGVVYVVITARNRERLAMIENGADPALFESKKGGITTLKWAVVMIAVAIGIFLGHFLEQSAGMDGDVVYPALIFLFGGIGLFGVYRLQKKELDKQ